MQIKGQGKKNPKSNALCADNNLFITCTIKKEM